jgi:hypothetical protein
MFHSFNVDSYHSTAETRFGNQLGAPQIRDLLILQVSQFQSYLQITARLGFIVEVEVSLSLSAVEIFFLHFCWYR